LDYRIPRWNQINAQIENKTNNLKYKENMEEFKKKQGKYENEFNYPWENNLDSKHPFSRMEYDRILNQKEGNPDAPINFKSYVSYIFPFKTYIFQFLTIYRKKHDLQISQISFTTLSILAYLEMNVEIMVFPYKIPSKILIDASIFRL